MTFFKKEAWTHVNTIKPFEKLCFTTPLKNADTVEWESSRAYTLQPHVGATTERNSKIRFCVLLKAII